MVYGIHQETFRYNSMFRGFQFSFQGQKIQLSTNDLFMHFPVGTKIPYKMVDTSVQTSTKSLPKFFQLQERNKWK